MRDPTDVEAGNDAEDLCTRHFQRRSSDPLIQGTPIHIQSVPDLEFKQRPQSAAMVAQITLVLVNQLAQDLVLEETSSKSPRTEEHLSNVFPEVGAKPTSYRHAKTGFLTKVFRLHIKDLKGLAFINVFPSLKEHIHWHVAEIKRFGSLLSVHNLCCIV